MSKSEKQKQKLLKLLEIFITETDDDHGITMSEIICKLAGFGIAAERKSIYNDFYVLEEMGYTVLKNPGKPMRYTLENRPFELPELKMLVDAVQVSKFITAKKSREIIKKLEYFAGRKANELSRQVYVPDKNKTSNQSTIYTIDTIHSAINNGRRVKFKYFDYNVNKERVFRHGGATYDITPCALLWNDENYYLVGYDESDGIIKNFRVDKIAQVKKSEQKHSLCDEVVSFNPSEYSNKIFGMYGGDEQLVTFEFKEKLAGVVLDKFGRDTTLIKTDFGFKFSQRVMVSPTFFAWVLSFGDSVRITAPQEVKDRFREHIESIMKHY